MKEDLNIVIERKQVIQKELDSSNQYVLTMEEKVYKSNKIALELLKRLKDAEVDLDTLKQYTDSLKLKIPVYKPSKDDDIDQQLSDFINKHLKCEKLSTVFERVSEGVYSFGTRKVKIFMENNKLRVRVGGGFLSLQEFLDQYLEIEFDKMTNRDDPVRRMKDKIKTMHSHRSILSTGRGRQSRSMQRSILETSGNHRRVKYDIE